MQHPNDQPSNLQRLRIEIHGAVQGVGFRPFVYRLATELELAGWVINDTRGVFIEVEGPQSDLERFLERLPAEKPPRAIINSLASVWLAPAGFDRFEIRHSETSGAKTVLVPPNDGGMSLGQIVVAAAQPSIPTLNKGGPLCSSDLADGAWLFSVCSPHASCSSDSCPRSRM